MNKRSVLILILLIGSLLTFEAEPARASTATIEIDDDLDDIWQTASGNVFASTTDVMLLSDQVDIFSYLRFNNIPLTKLSHLNNATLRIHTGGPSADNLICSVTIRGIDTDDCAAWTTGSTWTLTRPTTTAYVNWNLTDVIGFSYHTVDVTAIVQEIISRYGWTYLNSIGFKTIGAKTGENGPYRFFEDYYSPYDHEAELILNYDVDPDDPELEYDDFDYEDYDPDVWTWTFNGTVEGVDIWKLTKIGSSPVEFTFTEGPGMTDQYFMTWNETGHDDGSYQLIDNVATGSQHGAVDRIVRVGNQRIVNSGRYLYNSTDGVNWDSTDMNDLIGNAAYSSYYACLFKDPFNASLVHALLYTQWAGQSYLGTIYSNYTITDQAITGAGAFEVIATGDASGGSLPFDIYVDNQSRIHIGYTKRVSGLSAPFYNVRTGSTWGTPYQLMTGMTNNVLCTQICATNDDPAKVYTVWWQDDVYYNYFDGSTWTGQTSTEGICYGVSLVYDNISEIATYVWEDGSGPTDIEAETFAFSDGTPGASFFVGSTALDEVQPDLGFNPQTGTIEFIWGSDWNGHRLRHLTLYPNGTQGPAELITDSDVIAYYPNVVSEVGTFIAMEAWALIYNDTIQIVLEDDPENPDDDVTTEDIQNEVDEIVGHDPSDPDPGKEDWPTEGPLTRLRFRLYFLILGLCLVFGPLAYIAVDHSDPGNIIVCLFIMLFGFALLIYLETI